MRANIPSTYCQVLTGPLLYVLTPQNSPVSLYTLRQCKFHIYVFISISTSQVSTLFQEMRMYRNGSFDVAERLYKYCVCQLIQTGRNTLRC